MNNTTRILIVEDDLNDYDLAQYEIRRAVQNCELQRVETRKEYLNALKSFEPDLIVSDYSLPTFDGRQALQLAKERAPFTPLIIWTGSISEDIAVECMKAGAANYVLKENIKRLAPAVVHALEERQLLIEHDQALVELRASEARFRTFVNYASDAFFLHNDQGIILDVNQQACESLGYTPEELIGMTPFDFDADATPGFVKQLGARLRAGEMVAFDTRHRRKDGTVLPVEVRIRSFEENGQRLGIALVRDITERKRVEEKLRTSESRYRLATQATKDVIWEWDPDANQLLWTENAQSVFGYLPEEIGPDAAWWDEHIHPEDRERVTSRLNALTATVGGESVWSDEYRFLLKNGSYAYINDQAYIERDAAGRTIRMIGAMSNITERKAVQEELAKNEKRFRALIEHGMDNISLIAEDGTLLWEDPSLNIVLGYERGEFIGRSLFQLLYPKDVDWVSKLFAKLVREPGKHQDATFRLRHHDGTWRWIEATATNMLSEPSVKGIVINYRDVTDRIEAEMRINDLLSLNEKMLNHSPLGILTYKVTGECIFANENAANIVGATVENLMRQNFHTIAAWRKSGLYALVEKAISTKSVMSGDIYHTSTFGKTVWMAAHCVPFTSKDEEHVLLSITDITERKQAEVELQQKNDDLGLLKIVNDAVIQGQNLDSVMDLLSKELKRIFSTVGSTIYMFAADRRTLTMQHYAFAEETAHKIERLIGFPIPRIEIPIREGGYFHRAMISRQSAITSDPKDLQNWIAEFVETKFLPPIARMAIRKLIPHIFKLLNIRSTIIVPLIFGEEIIGFMDVSSSNLFTPKDLERIENIGEQLTNVIQRQQANERIRKSEEFLHGVQNSLSAHMAILNQQGDIVQVNQAWCEFGAQNGLQSENCCVGVNYLSICESATGSDRAAAQQVANAIREVLGGQRKALSVEYPCHGPLEKRWFTVHVTCFDDGEQKWVILAHENITERKQAEAAEREQRLLAEALRDTSQILSSSLDYGEVLDHILTAVGNVVPHDAATIMLIEEGAAHVVRSQGYQKRDPDTDVMEVRLPLAETTNLRQMFETKKPVVVHDTFTFPGWKKLVMTDWLRSNVGAPISVHGEVIGFILLDSQIPRFFNPVHAERLEAFANQAALAIHNANLLKQAQEEIAERKRVEESLQAEQEKVQNYLDIAGVIMLALDRQGTITLINQKGCEILGYCAEELIGRNWINTFLPEAIREEMQVVFQKLISGDTKRLDYFENMILTRTGEERLIAWHNTLVHDTQGNITSTLSSGEDITERRQAEQELRASEERFRQLATNIEEAFWMTDAQTGQEIYISPAAATIWGNSLENILNVPDAFINSVLPDDRAHVLVALERQKNGEKTEIEYRVQRPDGSIRWIWDRAFPVFDENGNVKMLAGIAADITERKQSEMELIQSQARYQDLFDSSPIALWEEDYSLVKKRIESLQEEGVTGLEEYFSAHPEVILELASLVKIIDVNRASMELYNVRQKDELLKNLPQFVSEETLMHFQDEILGLISRAKFDWEGSDHTLDGQKLIVMVNGSIPPGHAADWSKVIVSVTDVTERRYAEERLRASEERYHSLFQHLTDGFALHEIITDDQGRPVDYRFLEVNPAFEKLTGLRAETTIGRCVNEILPRVGNEHFIAIYGKVALTGEPIHFEEYSAPLGRYYEINAYSPRHGQFAITFEDITERKQAEADLRKLSRAVEQSASTIVITDIQGRIEYVNPKFTEITGYTFEEAIGQNPRLLKTGHTPPEEYRRLWGTITAGEEWRGELFNRKKNGDLFWEQVTISPIQNEQGEITHFVAVKEDITQRKQSEAEIQRHLVELQAVYENGLAVGQLLEPRQIGERLIETFARHLSWHHVTIRLLRPETDEMELIAFNLPNLDNTDKLEVEERFRRLIQKVGQGLSGYAVQTGTPIRTGQVQMHPQYVSTQAGIQSGLYMPLKIGTRVIGVISVEGEEPDAFTEQDERLLATLATQAAIAFENARLYQAAQQEISERKRAQAALRESEAHYRELADSITEIMFELDQGLRYTHWNKASEIFSGIPAEDAIGRSMQDMFGESEDQSYRERIYRRVLTEQRAQTFETVVFSRGQRRVLEINAYPSARGVSVVARDITERRLSEALQQKRFALMEYSARHTLDELMQRAIDEVSELTDSHIGFLHFVEADQKSIRLQAWSSETIQRVGRIQEKDMHYPLESAGIWADAVRQRQPIIHNDYDALPHKKGLPEGHVPVIRELVVPIIRDDNVAGILGIGNRSQPYDKRDMEITERFADYAWDIIERRQMESALSDERNQLAKRVDERTADLSRANSNLARALRVKDEFLANMSHELRTPLNAILGLSESLSEQVAGPLNEKQQKYLNTINESGHHLLSLINDILDLAKIEAGQITLDINKVDINSVCQASLRMIKQLAQKKNQEVLFEMEASLGLMWADERRLKQMIVNLLSNAVKFTPENGRLGLEVQGDHAGNRILITVWDRGIGISSQDLDRLFRPFVQLDSGLAREATGTGLGLALVAQMARLHGGSVTVDSQVGEGSRFTIQLPWEPALAADVSSRLRTTGKFRAIDIHAKNKPTILLIEDTREVVMMLADYLEMAGFTIATAQDGIDGLEQAKLTHPDLILMDIQMPRMDGFETTQKLRLIPEFKETPIIALTALAMPNDRQRCLDAGMSEYISKPVNLKMLLKLIRGILYAKEGNPA